VAFSKVFALGFSTFCSNSWAHSLYWGWEDGSARIKAFLKSKTIHTEPLLPTWVSDTKSECCSWEQVRCNTTTGHVIKLMLSSINQEQNYEDTWYINVSLFQPFKELRNLDLSNNRIAGWLGNEGMWVFASIITHTHTRASSYLCLA